MLALRRSSIIGPSQSRLATGYRPSPVSRLARIEVPSNELWSRSCGQYKLPRPLCYARRVYRWCSSPKWPRDTLTTVHQTPHVLHRTERRLLYTHSHTLCTTPASQQEAKQIKPRDVVFIPGFVKAKDLARILKVDLKEVVRYARELRYKFNKVSDLVLNWSHSAALAKKFKKIPLYQELDVSRPDYWSEEQSHPSNPVRPCVISILGHVDHGKTTLLDSLSRSNVADHEAGKITQSLSAFTVDLRDTDVTSPPSPKEAETPYTKYLNSLFADKTGRIVASSEDIATFLDTPGHYIFTHMRESGASIADIVVIIIAANEGIKEQTVESIRIATEANLPILVAINKIDISTPAQIESVYSQLHAFKLTRKSLTRKTNPLNAEPPNYSALIDEMDDVHPVVGVVEISAKYQTNLNILKRALMETTRALRSSRRPDLTIKPSTPPTTLKSIKDNGLTSLKLSIPPSVTPTAEATVIESYVKSTEGRVLLLLVHRGILKTGEQFVCDKFKGRIRSMAIADLRYIPKENIENSSFAKSVTEALPGLPALVTVSMESEIKGDVVPPSGAGFFQLRQADAESVYEYRMTMMQYVIKDAQGILFEQEKEKSTEDEQEKQNEEVLANAKLSKAKLKRALRLQKSQTKRDKFRQKREEIQRLRATGQLNRGGAGQIIEEEPNEMFLRCIVKADNHGRLDAIRNATNQLAAQYGVKLTTMTFGVGDVTPSDLEIGLVEAEENGAQRVPYFLYNVDIGRAGMQWMEKNQTKKGFDALIFYKQPVFYELLHDLRHEIFCKYPQLKSDESRLDMSMNAGSMYSPISTSGETKAKKKKKKAKSSTTKKKKTKSKE